MTEKKKNIARSKTAPSGHELPHLGPTSKRFHSFLKADEAHEPTEGISP